MKKIWLALLFSAPIMAQDSVYQAQHPKVRQLRDRAQDVSYDQGSRALDERHWEDAVRAFSKVADDKGAHADGALYWKAYAEDKLGQRDAALATIAQLRRDYATSRWLDDAKALEVEIHQQAGQPVSPGGESNDDLKMLALNGLLNSDPEQAVPLMEKVLRSSNSPALKDRALFVLSQSRSPKAQQLLADAAKGSFNPDLQIRALRYIATSGGSSRATLYSIYSSSNDLAVKKAILNYLIMSKFTGENDPLATIAKTEKNPELRAEAIRRLGMTGRDQTASTLISIYETENAPEVKREIAKALFIQGNAKALVDLARKETNLTIKQELVQELSHMHSKEATDYMVELLSK